MSDDLAGFLERQSEGGASHGASSFSLSPEKALQKIREFSFAEPNHWILALIQGCHAVPTLPRKIELSGREDKTTVTIRDLHLELLDALDNRVTSLVKLEPSVEPFRRAIWGLLNLTRFRVSHKGRLLQWDGRELTRDNVKTHGNDLVWTLVHRAEEEWQVRNAARARACLELLEVVQKRAWCGTVPIFVDGKPLSRHPVVGGDSVYSPLVLAEGSYGPDTGKLFRTEWNEARLRHSKPLFTFHHRGKNELLGFYCAVDRREAEESSFALLEGPSQRHLLKHGVVVYSETVGRGRIFFRAVYVNDEVETDLTGLAARVPDGSLFDKARLNRKRIESTWDKISSTLMSSIYVFDAIDAVALAREVPGGGAQSRLAGAVALTGSTVIGIIGLGASKVLLGLPLFIGAGAWFILAEGRRPASDLGRQLKLALQETVTHYST